MMKCVFSIFLLGYLCLNFLVMSEGKANEPRTVEDVIEKYGDESRSLLKPMFEEKGISYPPKRIAMIVSKKDLKLEIWSGGENSKLIVTYPLLAISGKLGPKLREGDGQIPEGIYKIIGFNPNSSYHLSMKLNYPNEFDWKQAKKEGRTEPGSDIFIHGKAVSIGCLAMGDFVIEDLFVLVCDIGKENVEVVISPLDPAKGKLTPRENSSEWVSELYSNIEKRVSEIRSGKK